MNSKRYYIHIVFDFDPKMLSFKTIKSQELPLSWSSSQLRTWAHKCHYEIETWKKLSFLKSRLLPFYKYRQGRYTNFPWKIFGNHVVCWTFSVANKSGHFSFGSFCVISFMTQGFLWFLGNQCSRARLVQWGWRLRGFSVQRIYYANRSSNRFLSAASAVLLLPSCVQPLTLHGEKFCVLIP